MKTFIEFMKGFAKGFFGMIAAVITVVIGAEIFGRLIDKIKEVIRSKR